MLVWSQLDLHLTRFKRDPPQHQRHGLCVHHVSATFAYQTLDICLMIIFLILEGESPMTLRKVTTLSLPPTPSATEQMQLCPRKFSNISIITSNIIASSGVFFSTFKTKKKTLTVPFNSYFYFYWVVYYSDNTAVSSLALLLCLLW